MTPNTALAYLARLADPQQLVGSHVRGSLLAHLQFDPAYPARPLRDAAQDSQLLPQGSSKFVKGPVIIVRPLPLPDNSDRVVSSALPLFEIVAGLGEVQLRGVLHLLGTPAMSVEVIGVCLRGCQLAYAGGDHALHHPTSLQVS